MPTLGIVVFATLLASAAFAADAPAPPGVDLSIAGVPLLDAEKAKTVVGAFKPSQEPSEAAFAFVNSTKTETVKLIVHPGSTLFQVAAIQLSAADKGSSLPVFPGNPQAFITGRGIRLGMSLSDVRSILGAPAHESPDRLDYVYHSVKWQWLIDTFNMPSYEGIYRFTENRLVSCRFGFPYP